MKSPIVILFISVLLISCSEKERKIEIIDLQTDYKLNSEIEQQLDEDTRSFKYQISAAHLVTKGDYKNALIHWDSAMPTPNISFSKTETDSLKSHFRLANAKEYILTEAAKHQVMMINEAHHKSKHRVFTRSLLEELYELGYTRLGLEALDNGEHGDTILNSRGYPIQKTGHYIKEPQFGNLVRDALSIGFELFAYEGVGVSGGKPREIAQAKNIQKHMQDHPDEKILIHCGFAHLMEGDYPSWEKTMAGRLTEYTGIDPFTVDQTKYGEKSQKDFYPPMLKVWDVEEPSVLINENNKVLGFNRRGAYTDMILIHPITDYLQNRPSWMFNEEYKISELSLMGIGIKYPIMLLAYKKGEDINSAVPIDILEIDSPQEKAYLSLPEGEFTIVATNKEESVKFIHQRN